MAFEEIKALKAEYDVKKKVAFKMLKEIENSLNKNIAKAETGYANTLENALGCINRIRNKIDEIRTNIQAAVDVKKDASAGLNADLHILHDHFYTLLNAPVYQNLADLRSVIVNHLKEFDCKEEDDLWIAVTNISGDFVNRWNKAIKQYKK